MRNVAFVALLMMSCAACLAADAMARLNESLKTDAAITYYANCFLDRGHCSADGRAVKWLLPDLVATSCAKCSTKQKRVGCRIITLLQQKKYAEIWSALLKKYDPKKVYIKNLENFNKNCETKFKVTIPKEVAETTKASTAATAEAHKVAQVDDEEED